MIPVALVLGAFALRLYAALVPGIIVPDGVLYIDTAKMIMAGQWQQITERGIYSIYPLLIVVFQKVFTEWETAGRMVSVAFGSLAVLPFYFIIRRIFDVRIALVAASFFVISPRLVEYSSNVIREPVSWFFSLAALWVAEEAIHKRQWLLMVPAAFFVGLAAFTRMEGIVVAGIIILWIWWYCRKEKTFSRRTFLSLSLVFVISFPVLFFPPLLALKNRLGQWELGHIGSKIPRILKANSDGVAETFRKELNESDVVSRAVSDNKYALFLWQAVYKFLRSYHVLFIFLFIIGVTRRKVIPWESREVFVLIWWSAFFLVSLLYVSKIYYLSTRHGMLMSIPALVWVSIGFYELSDVIENTMRRFVFLQRYKGRLVVVTFVVICLIVLPKALTWSGYDKVEMKEAGVYLKKLGYSKKKIALESRLSRLGFYADADFFVIPEGVDHDDLEEFLLSNHIAYVVIDEKVAEKSFGSGITAGMTRIDTPELDTFKEYSFRLFKTGISEK